MLILIFLIIVVGVGLAYGRKAAGKTILITVGVILSLLIAAFIFIYASTKESSVNTTPINFGNTITSGNTTASSASPNEKCVVEDKNLKICDLSFSDSYYTSDYRDILVEGNAVACVDMKTGAVTQGNAESLRATTNPAYCVTDWGYVYIDPSLYVSKHYGSITREDYGKPYKTPGTYDTCIWTYSDGSASVPYLEVLSSVGPRSGFSVKAFCKSGSSRVDIYTYKD